MKIYTGKGDLGETSDCNGRKISKNSGTIHLLGTLDELTSHLGLIRAMLRRGDSMQTSCHFIEKTQRTLMKIMPLVCGAPSEMTDADINALEKEIDRLTENTPEKKEFAVPGKNIMEAQIHIARTIARKAERYFFALNEKYPELCQKTGVYLNRLSDYLFVLSLQDSLENVDFIN